MKKSAIDWLAHYGVVTIVGFIVVILIVPDSAAQEAAASFEELNAFVKPGDTVRVADVSGHTTEGRIERISSSALRLAVMGRASRDFSQTDVVKVDRLLADSVFNGMAIGSLVGFGTGGALTLVACQISYLECSRNPGKVMTFLGVFTGIGAGLGVLMDLSIMKPQTIYATHNRSSRLSITPVLGGDRKGLQLSVKF
jgi:hypothetical protein